MNYEEQIALQKKAADIIDTSWRSSWHWDKTEHGVLTEKGWEQVRNDAVSERHSLLRRITAIDGLLEELRERDKDSRPA